VTSARESKARWLLPSIAFSDEEDLMTNEDTTSLDLYFDRNTIEDALKNRGYDTKAIETPYELKPAGNS